MIYSCLLVEDHQPDTFGTFLRTDFIIFNLETKKFDTVQLGSSPNLKTSLFISDFIDTYI
jgi:hypothetical protein